MTTLYRHPHPCPACLDDLFVPGWSMRALLRFHTAHKLVLMAHSPEAYRALGRLVAGAQALRREEVERRYVREFSAAVAIAVTRGRHVNVLQHAAGYFTDRLEPADTATLQAAIEDYRRDRAPLMAPIMLIGELARTLGVEYLTGQVYVARDPPVS